LVAKENRRGDHASESCYPIGERFKETAQPELGINTAFEVLKYSELAVETCSIIDNNRGAYHGVTVEV
jgi:hypothetical protein